ncbi:MAG TPA: DJ-1/PfpI family protein [Candidatus Ornithomonoglobus intestinigallinarum]|uniref:DJ-1/PfpI family protein n=1 Tax=Candidatus Ornithomonoglobus intestinigallinarum TaxID=2840894 RepID=A0A9D1KRJ4_9FIRM|nr:DJ-1/PfpI family protein [Candidatus Ornithomonoglobus intestinigallinarum]
MVYLLLADGFEEIEAVTPVDILRRGGVEVTTVSIKDKLVAGAHGIAVEADKTISELDDISDMEMLILPGGGGHELLDASNDVHAMINYAHERGIYIAAICAAPSILGKKMLLSGKNAVCYPGFEKYLYGANICSDKAVKDGRFITGKGPGAAAEFGFELLSVLKGGETAEKLGEIMQY